MRAHSSHESDQIFAFVHIEKCGGQSFGRMLRRSYGLQHQDLISLRRSADLADEADVAHLLRLFPRCRSIMGHNVRPYCEFGRFQPRMVFYTLLRDPIDRYVSDYAMHVRGGFQGTFAQWSTFDFQHNLIVRTFSQRGDLAEAQDVFEERIAFYDTLNNFDRFVGHARDVLPHQRLATTYIVVNDKPDTHLPIDLRDERDVEKVRQRAAELNRLDVDFYDWAQARLSAATAIPPSRPGHRVAREQGIGHALNYWSNMAARNLIYKPSCGLRPGEVDSIAKYRAPWPVDADMPVRLDGMPQYPAEVPLRGPA